MLVMKNVMFGDWGTCCACALPTSATNATDATILIRNLAVISILPMIVAHHEPQAARLGAALAHKLARNQCWARPPQSLYRILMSHPATTLPALAGRRTAQDLNDAGTR